MVRTDYKNVNKICKLKKHERKIYSMCISVDDNATKILASKFLTVIEILSKNCWGNSCSDTDILYLEK